MANDVEDRPEGSGEDIAKPDAPKSAKFWHSQLAAAAKREEDWHRTAREVVCRYNDDRKGYTAPKDSERRINILWSNTEVQKGALFAQLGSPDVRRMFPKPGTANKIARTAALVLERAVVACNNRYNPERKIRDAVENQLLSGRGQCWLEYEPQLEADAETNKERIAYQKAHIAFVDWMDFRHGPGKCWDDVPWVARPHLFTKEDVERQFPEFKDKIPLNFVLDEGMHKTKEDLGDFKRAKIWEIWYKPEKIRVYVAEGCDVEISRSPDPYRLEGFFPCPEPIYAVKTAGTLMPRAEYLQYQDQAAELDRINTRIYRLLEKLRYCGVYDGSADDTSILSDLGNLEDGQFLPYKHWQALSTAGGLAGAFQTRDLAPIAATIVSLSQRAIQLVQSVYEITGISDVMRGQTDASETLGAQQLKARFGSQRMQMKQKEVQRFVRDLFRMKGELIAEHFEREQLIEMTGVNLPFMAERDAAKKMLAEAQATQQASQAPQQGQGQLNEQMPPQMAMQRPMGPPPSPEQLEEAKEVANAVAWEEIEPILRTDDRRNYNIDIETDATVFEDAEVEKQQALEYAKVMGEMLAQAIPAIQMNPSLGPLMKEMTLFVSKKFKSGRTLEETLDDAFSQIQNTPSSKGPSPEEMKMQAEMQKMQSEVAAQAQMREVEMTMKREEHQMRMAELSAKLQAQRDEIAMKRESMELDAQIMLIKAQSDAAAMARKTAFEGEKMNMQRQSMQDKAAQDASSV